MSSSIGTHYADQRNAHRNANAGTTMKRRIDNNRGCGGGGGVVGGFQEDRMRYAPPQKRARYQTQSQFQPAPLYHRGSNNLSRVSNCVGDVNGSGSNSSNSFPFAVRNNDSPSQSNTDYQKPFGFGNPNPNPQLVPLPLPYRKLDDFDSLPEWVPNRSNFPIRSPNFVPEVTGVRFNAPLPSSQAPVFTNVPNPMPMVSIASQAMMPQQPIVGKELSDLLNLLINNEKEKQNKTSEIDEAALCLDFGSVNLNVRNESVIKSLYSDMPRQCTSCGVRFKCQEEHSKHMDWHARKNRMSKEATKTTNTRMSQKPQKSREWFASESLWLSAATVAATEAAKPYFAQRTKEEEKQEQQHTVPADENQKLCALCIEPFEEFFCHEEDDWLYKDAVYLNMNGSGPIVHAKCMPLPRKVAAKDSKKPMVMPVSVPLVC